MVTTTAEGYGGVLDGIKQGLGQLNKKMETKFSAHDKALANPQPSAWHHRAPAPGKPRPRP